MLNKSDRSSLLDPAGNEKPELVNTWCGRARRGHPQIYDDHAGTFTLVMQRDPGVAARR